MQWRGLYESLREALMLMFRGHGGGSRGRHGTGGPVVTVPDSVTTAYPNKPAGMTLRYSLNVVNPQSPLTGSNSGTLIPNTGLDVSDGGLRTTWPSGTTAGDSVLGSPVDMGRDDTKAYQSCYVYAKFYLPDPTFTSQVVQSKLAYLRFGSRAQTNAGTVVHLTPCGLGGNNTSRASLQLMGQTSQNLAGGSIPLYANAYLRNNAWLFTTQVEHTVEMYTDVGTVDNHDATYKLWLDGVLYCDYSPTSPYFWGNPDEWSGSITSPTNKGAASWLGTWINSNGSSNIKMLDSASTFTVGIYGVHYDQVWGGTGGSPTTKAQTDHSVLRAFDYFVGSVLT